MRHHYYRTPPEKSKTVEDCWNALSDYLQEHAKRRIIFFRETPQVFSERDFDTKQIRHVGIVRFSASLDKSNEDYPIVGAA